MSAVCTSEKTPDLDPLSLRFEIWRFLT